MAIVHISLPEHMKQYIDDRIREGSYNTMAEYFQYLIRADQKQQAEECLETLLLRGLESPTSEWAEEDANHVKNAIRERMTTSNSKPSQRHAE